MPRPRRPATSLLAHACRARRRRTSAFGERQYRELVWALLALRRYEVRP